MELVTMLEIFRDYDLPTIIVGIFVYIHINKKLTVDVGFVNATDINSSLGRRVYSYRGVFSNTLNWELLPTDVTPKIGTFVN